MSVKREEVLSYLRQIDAYEFERFVADLWEQYGWETRVTSGSNDHGVDFVAKKSKPFNQKHHVQVKRWASNNKVSAPEIQQYSSLRHREPDIDSVVVVTTSSFSRQAVEESKNLNVKLVDGSDLYKLIVESEDGIREYADSSGSNQAENKDKPQYDTKLDIIKIKSDLIPAYKMKLRGELVNKTVEMNQKYKWNGNEITIVDIRPQDNDGGGIVTESTDIRFI